MKENNRLKIRNCTQCGKEYTAVPALSRSDNRTLICPDCGILEALAGLGIEETEQEQILGLIHQSAKN